MEDRRPPGIGLGGRSVGSPNPRPRRSAVGRSRECRSVLILGRLWRILRDSAILQGGPAETGVASSATLWPDSVGSLGFPRAVQANGAHSHKPPPSGL